MLDLRDKYILNSLPYKCQSLLSVGSGKARLEQVLYDSGMDVYCTDIEIYSDALPYRVASVFETDAFEPRDCVMCCEVLEHLDNYQLAFRNLIKYALRRLIVTVPYKRSFFCDGHVNFWDDASIKEFTSLSLPYAVSITKIRSKPADREMGQHNFIIILANLLLFRTISLLFVIFRDYLEDALMNSPQSCL